MKKLLALVALAAALPCVAQDLPTEIKLTNGFVMKDCTIVRWEAGTITVKYAGGTVPVRFENIDPSDRVELMSHREEALQQQAEAEEKAAKALAQAKHQQAEAEKRAVKQQAELDRKNAAIQQGLEQHRLVAGMTMDQVRCLYGPPWQFSLLTNANASEWWIYPGLGKGASGAPTNLQIHFKAGVVTRWNNTQR